MGIYITSGNWARGCTYRVSPDENSVLPLEDGVEVARRLFAMPEEEFWQAILARVRSGQMTHSKADKAIGVYLKKITHNAYTSEGEE